jgi:hypothetical protein
VLDVLRPALLDGVRVHVTGDPGFLSARLQALGADIGGAGCQALVCGAGDLHESLDTAWRVTRETAAAQWIDEGSPPGKVVFVTPAGPVGAALGNLARTLSIEWARYGITISAVVGGGDDQVAELVAYLVSPAGDYYSGCTFTLG